jgi:hypothetical protein
VDVFVESSGKNCVLIDDKSYTVKLGSRSGIMASDRKFFYGEAALDLPNRFDERVFELVGGPVQRCRPPLPSLARLVCPC